MHYCDIRSQHIPTTLNRNNLNTELKYFYQNITNNTLHLTIDTLQQNDSIVVLNQDKERGVVIHKSLYAEKCLSILDTS